MLAVGVRANAAIIVNTDLIFSDVITYSMFSRSLYLPFAVNWSSLTNHFVWDIVLTQCKLIRGGRSLSVYLVCHKLRGASVHIAYCVFYLLLKTFSLYPTILPSAHRRDVGLTQSQVMKISLVQLLFTHVILYKSFTLGAIQDIWIGSIHVTSQRCKYFNTEIEDSFSLHKKQKH